MGTVKSPASGNAEAQPRLPLCSSMRPLALSLRLVLLITAVVHPVSSQITGHPQTQVGFEGRRVSFSCTSFVGVKRWFINDKRATSAEFTGEPYNAEIIFGGTSQLSIKASSATNNSVVACKLYNPPNNEESTAILLVQGLLSAPGDLNPSVDGSSITLSWNHPPFLPGSEDDTSFKITVSVPAVGHSSYLLTPHTNHTFSFSELNINRCHSDHTIDFTVAGMNPAGEGDSAFVIASVTQDADLCGEAEQDIGRLGPPSTRAPTLNADSVSLAWTPPFTLTDISHYNIAVMDETSVVLTRNTSDLSITIAFTDLDVDLCTRGYRYTVSIFGVNSVGEGDISNTTLEIPQDTGFCPTTTRTTLTKTTTEASTSSNPQQDLLIVYISASVPAGVIVALGILVSCAAICTCCTLKKRKKVSNTGDSELTMEPNGAYIVAPMISNPAYEKPHLYEQIDPAVPLYEVITVKAPSGATSPVRSYSNFRNA